MKILKYLFYFLFSLAIMSCSDDDNNNIDQIDSNHFPLTPGNSWIYNNQTIFQNESANSPQETITVASTSEEQGVTYYTLESNLQPMEQGFFTKILTTGNLIMANNQLIYNGEFSVDLSNLGYGIDNLSIPLNNVIIFDADADSGKILTEDNNTITQSIDFEGTAIPFFINYNLTTIQNDFLDSFTAGGENFKDVLSADIIVNLEINTSIMGVTLPILESQDAIQISNYFANDIGMVYSETSVNYDFENITFPSVPAIPDLSVNYTQEIDSYIINE